MTLDLFTLEQASLCVYIKVGPIILSLDGNPIPVRKNLIESAIRTFFANDFIANKQCHVRICHNWLLYRILSLFLNVLTDSDFCMCESSVFHVLTTLLLTKFLRRSRRAFGTCTFSVGVEEPSSSMCVLLRVGCGILTLAGVNHVLGLTIPFRILNDWIISPRWRLADDTPYRMIHLLTYWNIHIYTLSMSSSYLPIVGPCQ